MTIKAAVDRTLKDNDTQRKLTEPPATYMGEEMAQDGASNKKPYKGGNRSQVTGVEDDATHTPEELSGSWDMFSEVLADLLGDGATSISTGGGMAAVHLEGAPWVPKEYQGKAFFDVFTEYWAEDQADDGLPVVVGVKAYNEEDPGHFSDGGSQAEKTVLQYAWGTEPSQIANDIQQWFASNRILADSMLASAASGEDSDITAADLGGTEASAIDELRDGYVRHKQEPSDIDDAEFVAIVESQLTDIPALANTQMGDLVNRYKTAAALVEPAQGVPGGEDPTEIINSLLTEVESFLQQQGVIVEGVEKCKNCKGNGYKENGSKCAPCMGTGEKNEDSPRKRKASLMAASDFYCEECGENLGKDTQLGKKVGCGTCGADGMDNPRGDDEDEVEASSKEKEFTGLEAQLKAYGIDIPKETQ